MSDIKSKIEQELENARATCGTSGDTSSECAAAWDVVEELQAEASHQKHKTTNTKTSLEEYCDANPDAAECRIYDD